MVFECAAEELIGFHKLVKGRVRSCLELRKKVSSREWRTGGFEGCAWVGRISMSSGTPRWSSVGWHFPLLLPSSVYTGK